MDSFSLNELLAHAENSSQAYLEFHKVPDLSVGIYRLPAGGTDPQSPHNEDEVYFVIEGKGEIQVGQEIEKVEHGSIVYVPAHVEHRFQNILEDLKILVFFAPAESKPRDI